MKKVGETEGRAGGGQAKDVKRRGKGGSGDGQDRGGREKRRTRERSTGDESVEEQSDGYRGRYCLLTSENEKRETG